MSIYTNHVPPGTAASRSTVLQAKSETGAYRLIRSIALAGLLLTTSYAGQLAAATIGDPIIQRAEFDGGTGQFFVYAGMFPIAGEKVTNWSFYNDGTATNNCSTGMASYTCYPGNSITPVILSKTGTNTFTVTGVGTTRPNSLAGLQTFPFGLVAGTDIVGPNSTFGFRSGGPTGTSPYDFGVVQFNEAAGLGFFYFGENAQITTGNSYAGSGPFPRAYSIQFTTGPAAARFSICLLYDPTKAVHTGATIPIKLQLCDGNGNDVSSSGINLQAVSITQTSAAIPSLVMDSGNANPDNGFRFDATLGSSTGGYIFNLKTTGLSTGAYNLNFTVTGDSAIYAAPFQVK